MKKSILRILVIILAIVAFPLVSMAAGTSNISVYVNSEEQIKFDVPPVEQSGRTLVPVRALFEYFGYTVEWKPLTGTIIAKQETEFLSLEKETYFKELTSTKEIVLKVNSKEAKVNYYDNKSGVKLLKNSYSYTLDVPAKTIKGRTLVPLRFVTESMGYDVEWNDKTLRINIITDKGKDAQTKISNNVFTYFGKSLSEIESILGKGTKGDGNWEVDGYGTGGAVYLYGDYPYLIGFDLDNKVAYIETLPSGKFGNVIAGTTTIVNAQKDWGKTLDTNSTSNKLHDEQYGIDIFIYTQDTDRIMKMIAIKSAEIAVSSHAEACAIVEDYIKNKVQVESYGEVYKYDPYGALNTYSIDVDFSEYISASKYDYGTGYFYYTVLVSDVIINGVNFGEVLYDVNCNTGEVTGGIDRQRVVEQMFSNYCNRNNYNLDLFEIEYDETKEQLVATKNIGDPSWGSDTGVDGVAMIITVNGKTGEISVSQEKAFYTIGELADIAKDAFAKKHGTAAEFCEINNDDQFCVTGNSGDFYYRDEFTIDNKTGKIKESSSTKTLNEEGLQNIAKKYFKKIHGYDADVAGADMYSRNIHGWIKVVCYSRDDYPYKDYYEINEETGNVKNNSAGEFSSDE